MLVLSFVLFNLTITWFYLYFFLDDLIMLFNRTFVDRFVLVVLSNLLTTVALVFSHSGLNVGFSDNLQLEGCPVLSDSLGFKDEIGEFSVEGSSSSLAWSMASKTLIHVCRRIYMQTGTLKFFCKHAEDIVCEKAKDNFVCLAKFRGISDSVQIPSVIGSYAELETLNEELTKWVDLDRFGLDVEFVQEIVEQLPGSKACSNYVFLNERSSYSSNLMVGNGNLLIKAKDTDDDSVVNDHCLPPGNPISSRVPPQLLGDVLQISDFLGRFYNVLDLKEPLSVEDLEKELQTPWFEGLNQEMGSLSSVENSHTFIHMGNQATMEGQQPSVAPITNSGCPIFALTKVHNSLVKILVTEMQSKVVAVADPKLDNGEVRSKRGRKKDPDSLITAKRIKLITLPLIELTWPELARRYILSVLAMDGNHDSAEVITRETAKVSRCLQGDGRVLCGSVTGVAGIEADAQLLAEASKKIFGFLNRENNILFIEEESDVGSSDKPMVSNGDIQEWAKVLEPVRKLPTNVVARIRRCVNESLEKGPPGWAKKILEHSISKEVYKGNASGPTKKAVLSVLEKMKESLSVEDLEKELRTPWFEGLNQEMGPLSSVENSHTFIQMGKQATMEGEQPSVAPIYLFCHYIYIN